MKKLIPLLVIVLFTVMAYSQNHKLIDSLHKQLRKEKIDSVKADLLNELSGQYFNSVDYIKAEDFGKQALLFAQKANYTKGIINSCFNLIYANHLDWIKGKYYFDKAAELALQTKNKKLIARVYTEIADYMASQNRYQPEFYAKNALEIYKDLKDSAQMAECNYKLAEIYGSWNKTLSKGEPEKALKYLDESLGIFKQLDDVDGIMKCYMSYSNIYKLYFSDKARTLEYLKIADKEIGNYLKQAPDNHNYRTREHINYFHFGMYYSEMEHDFQKAEAFLKKSISLAQKNDLKKAGNDLNQSMLGSYYRHLAQLYLDNNNLTDAAKYFETYIKYFDPSDTVNLCFKLLNCEWIYRNKGMLAKAYDYLNKVTYLSQKANNFWLKWQSKYFLADLYQLMEDHETAKKLYFDCYQIALEGRHFAGQIVSNTLVSRIYARMNMLDSALHYNQMAENLNATSIKDTLLYVWVYHDLGGIYERKMDFKKALSLYLKVYEIRAQNNWNQTIETPYTYLATNSCLARVYIELKDYNKAFEFVQKSLASFQLMQYPEVLRDDYLTLSKIYEVRNQQDMALEFYKKYTFEKEKILADQNVRKLQLIEIEKIENQKKLEIESLEVKNLLKETKLRQQSYLIYSIIAVLVLVLILVFVIYKSYRQKSEANQLLKKNELELLDKNKRLQQLNEEVNAQNEQITIQRDLLAKQKEKITDSIVYASLIQCALLPSEQLIRNIFPNHFILFKPKDLVSGDFYWFKKIENFVYIAVADCTGHGVPGAFMGTLGISMLNEFMNTSEIKSPETILEELRNKIKTSLHQECIQDGMDMAMCMLNMQTNKLYFSGANLPFYLIRDNKLTEFMGNRMPIGRYPKDDQKFICQEIELKPNDRIYLFTDGFVSQFGGEQTLKYSAKRFREMLLSFQDIDMETQKQDLIKSLSDWQDSNEQVDDILILGIRI